MVTFSSCQKKESSQGESFLSQVDQIKDIVNDSDMLAFFENERNPIQPAFQPLPTGSNRPDGWLMEMMKQDLNNGIVGALDDLYPGFSDDIFNTNRRGGLDDVPEMGDIVLTGAEWEQSIMWWNAETIGNWWDGFIRHAFLTGDEQAIAQSRAIIENLLASQDEDGYIGIYKENLRYKHEGSNGELWAQTTAFRTMLGYYELAGDQRVLDAVEKGMAVTMKNYNKGARNPFYLKNAFGGVTHGLMLTDVCETLHRITGKSVYQDYATYLYEAFSTYSINRAFNDLRYPFLMEKDTLFTGHGVHTYEHFRTMVNAYYATGYPELKQAYDNALYKLKPTILPSGAGHANEWIAGLTADPDETATEFCTMLELRNSLGSILQKTGEASFGDHAEKLTFNGIMGFRNREGTGITYSKHDNCYILDGKSREEEGLKKEVRYKYSPTHEDPAVCCVPNYTRNYTYYVDMMWMKKEDGLVAVLYGPSVLKTEINGARVEVHQITGYPFSDAIRFEIETSEDVAFSLYFRKPGWVADMQVNADNGEPILENGFYKISKSWKSGDVVEVLFKNEIKVQKASNGESYFQRGPLVYAYEIPSEKEVIKEYERNGFSDYYALPTDESYKNWALPSGSNERNSGFSFMDKKITDTSNPWLDTRFILEGEVIDVKTKKSQKVRLRPMGCTILRKVTFPIR